MARNRASNRPSHAESSGFMQRRRPLGPGESVPLPSDLLGQVLALREAAKRVPPPRQDDETEVEDLDPDLPD